MRGGGAGCNWSKDYTWAGGREEIDSAKENRASLNLQEKRHKTEEGRNKKMKKKVEQKRKKDVE